MAYVTNPFQNLELRIPEAYRPQVDRYCRTQPGGGSKPSPDDSPFERQLDIWFLAVCLGARKGKTNTVKKWHRFITGEILSRDPYRIELLELLAIAHTKNPWIIDKPEQVMDLVNELAAAGLAELFEMLAKGNDKPIWNLTESLMNEFSISS